MGRKQRWLTGAGVGAVVSAMAAANVMAANINVTVKNASGPVSVATTGTNTVSVTVTNKGSVTNPSGPAITVTAQQGAVAVTDNGAVSASGVGIYATNTSADGVSITVNQSLQASGTAGVSAFDNGVGAASVTIGSGGKGNPLTITSPQVVDAVAISGSGPASVTVGANDSFSAGAPGVFQAANLAAVGILTTSDPSGGGPALSITTGRNDTFVLQGNNSAAIAAHTGVAGSFGPNGSASVGIVVGHGVSIHVSGLSDAGVIGFVADPASGKFSGTGDVSVLVGKGQITVDETGAVGVPTGAATNSGVVALSGGGNVLIDDAAQVNVSGGADASVGLLAVTSGAGTATINARASVTSANGDAIKSRTVNGANTVNVPGGQVTASIGDGIDAVASGTGDVTVTTAASSDVKTLTHTGFSGIYAYSVSGNVTVTSMGTVSDGGINAVAGGAGSVYVHAQGAVTNTAGAGISVGAFAGPASVRTEDIVTASGDGVFVRSQSGAATAYVGADVSAAGGQAVESLALGSAPASVTFGSGTKKHPLTISGAISTGGLAVDLTGPASVTVGDHVSFAIGAPGANQSADVSAVNLAATADQGATPSASTTVGSHDTFNLQGNLSAAVVAQVGLTGGPGPNGSASAKISIGDDVAIHVSGLSDAGVISFVADPSGKGTFGGSGNVSITVGTGSITVDEIGAVGAPQNAKTNSGIAAISFGGNVLIDDAATVSASGGQDASLGLVTFTAGAGTSTIDARASVTSANGDAIKAQTANGANIVNVLGGNVASTGGDGVDATASGAGPVAVTTAAETDVATATPGPFFGILASSGSGDVSVTTNGSVSEGGIKASTGGGGAVTVSTGDGVTNSAGVGISATAASGQVSVVTGGPVTASADRIFVQSSGTATVVARDSVSSATGYAIRTRTVSGANTVNVYTGQIYSHARAGVYASASGSGSVTITTARGTDVAAVNPFGSAGLAAYSAAGDVVIRSFGTVSDGGIGAFAGGSGSAYVLAANTVNDNHGGGVSAAAFYGTAEVVTKDSVTASGGAGVFVRTDGPGGASAVVGGNVQSGGAGAAAIETHSSLGASSITIASGTAKHPLTVSEDKGTGGLALSIRGGPVSIVTGDHDRFSAGGAGVYGPADLAAVNVAATTDQGGTPSAIVTTGSHDTFDLRGNFGAGIAAQVGVAAQGGPNGNASVKIDVGDDVAIQVSGLANAGVIGFVADPSGRRTFGGSGAVSITVGTGSITVDEVGAIGAAHGTNSGIAAISYGGNVLIDDSAAVFVSGGQGSSLGLIAYTAKAGTVTINARASVTSLNGNGVQSTTGDGANTVNIFAGTVSAPSASGVDIVTHGAGAASLSISADAAVSGLTGVTITSANLASLDNQGAIAGNASDHGGLAVNVTGAGGLVLNNEFGATLDGRIIGADHIAVHNAGLWQTTGVSDLGTAAGAASNTLDNTGTIRIGQSGPASHASAAAFLDLGAFDNGSASATGVVTMVNGVVGDTLTVGGPFVGAPGNSILALDAFLGGPGSTADQLILLGGSSGQTLIRIRDVNKGPGALNPDGIVLVQGATSAGDFALDPTQPHYDAALHGIDKGLFVYPLAYVGTNEELVGVPGAPALQLATMASAAEQVWSSTSPGGDSAESLRASFADGGDGPRVWAKALNGGASRLNGGRTLMGEAGFASQADVGPPMSAEVSGAATVSAFGMTYGFNTGYAQNTSALITGVDFGRHVGQRSAWSWGLSTGYLESQQSFSRSSALALYSGAMAALHGAFIAGGFYVDGDAKVTALKVSYASAWPGAGAPGASITTFGGEAEAGWRAALGGGWRLEPSGSLSVQSSSLGALTVAGTAVRFGAADSVRVGLGAKLEGGWRLFGAELKSDTALRFWDELAGANVLDLGGAGAGYALPDRIGGAFADASEALSLQSSDGKSSAFVSGAYRWKSNYQAAQITAGVKLRW